jgi:hypothetical protein
MCFIKFDPGRAHFLQLLKYAVLQYAVLRPLLAVAGCIMHFYGVLCPASLSPKHPNIWFMVVLCISVNISFYALLMLYMAIADDLARWDPFSKFFAIKLAIFYPFYQYVVIAVAANRGLIHETQYWTRLNLVNGIHSFLVCLEFVVFAVLFAKAFDYRVYRPKDRSYSPGWWWRGWVDAMNPMDYVREMVFGLRYLRWMWFGGKPPPVIAQSRRATMDLAAVMNRARPGGVEFPPDWKESTLPEPPSQHMGVHAEDTLLPTQREKAPRRVRFSVSGMETIQLAESRDYSRLALTQAETYSPYGVQVMRYPGDVQAPRPYVVRRPGEDGGEPAPTSGSLAAYASSSDGASPSDADDEFDEGDLGRSHRARMLRGLARAASGHRSTLDFRLARPGSAFLSTRSAISAAPAQRKTGVTGPRDIAPPAGQWRWTPGPDALRRTVVREFGGDDRLV